MDSLYWFYSSSSVKGRMGAWWAQPSVNSEDGVRAPPSPYTFFSFNICMFSFFFSFLDREWNVWRKIPVGDQLGLNPWPSACRKFLNLFKTIVFIKLLKIWNNSKLYKFAKYLRFFTFLKFSKLKKSYNSFEFQKFLKYSFFS